MAEGMQDIRRTVSNWLWRIVPISFVIAVSSYVLSKQLIRPHQRVIKASLLLVVLIILLKFEMILSLYFFIVMLPFPSGIVLTSTNVILLTIITLVWLIRARATGEKLFEKTDIDLWVILFLGAYLISLFNVETTRHLYEGFKLIWRQLTAFAFFYLIVRFVDTEQRLERITKVIGLAGALVAFTGVVELFAPGVTIIPGWIETRQQLGKGMLGYRLEGIRLGGAFGAHNLLSDYCSFTIFFMITHFLRSKNPIEKAFWSAASLMTVAVLMATANRGATFSLAFGFAYSLWVFRRHMSLVRYVILITSAVAIFGVTQLALDRYTIAASITQRVMVTYFVGGVPDSRVGVWEQVFRRCLDHMFIGHGPYYETSKGLIRYFWPHNAYLYYFHTIGLLGLSIFLIIAYRLVRISLRYRHPLIAGSFLEYGLSIFNVQIAMFLVGQMRTDHQRHTDSIYIYVVWMLFGLIAATGNMLKKKERQIAQRALETDTG
ncbi:MAG: O-antigen ligase family protein [Candidatus Latescibacterota bacterium]|nr:MAG: O-antigen ligase family protein [Candidatus Latescibacterota bacterium]